MQFYWQCKCIHVNVWMHLHVNLNCSVNASEKMAQKWCPTVALKVYVYQILYRIKMFISHVLCGWCVVSALALLSCGSRHIIQVDAAHWWWLCRDPPHPTPPHMIVKRFGCTTIHNKALYKCIIHSFIQKSTPYLSVLCSSCYHASHC